MTGESLPASKTSGDAIIRRGEIGALVYATGSKTYFGKTADLVQSEHSVSHFQKAVLRIGNYLIMLAVGLVAVIIGIGVSSLGDSKRDESQVVAKSIEAADGFAQVFPEHKFHIVDVLQKRGHIVGMTGDGVNDAPALNQADCGIAVSGANDAARAAAAIVLMTPGLSVIIDAIKES